jgi:lysophospholipase L1-like esterase
MHYSLACAQHLAALYTFLWVLTFGEAQAGSPIRIECIGDSTTAGYTDNPTWNVEFTFGYRLGLYQRLIAANYSIQYVGASKEPWSGAIDQPRFIGSPDLRDLDQDHHRGYGWMTVDGVRSHITDWLAADNPDLILLMIGRVDFPYGTTTNIGAVENSLSNLVEKIVTERPQVYLIVAQITPYCLHPDPDPLLQYDNYIRDVLVPSYANRGKRVSTVDLYTDFLKPGGGPDAIDPSLYAEGWQHANPAGNDRIAQSWFEAIRAIFPSNPITLRTPPGLLPNGDFHAGFLGNPGAVYRIDQATSAGGPWELGVTNLTADASGCFDLEDPNPGTASTRFYRVSVP